MKKIFFMLTALLMLALLLCGCSGETAVSDSDAPERDEIPVVWEQLPDEESYLEMMSKKLNEYIRCITTLSTMERRLTVLADEEKIAADEQYAAIAEQLGDWCEGARSYPADTLINDRAKAVCLQMAELAGATEDYLEVLPSMLAGTYEGELTHDDYRNSLTDSAVYIFGLLNGEELITESNE